MEIMKVISKDKSSSSLFKYTGACEGEKIEVYGIDEIKPKINKIEINDCLNVINDNVLGFVKMKNFYCSKNANYVQVYNTDVEKINKK